MLDLLLLSTRTFYLISSSTHKTKELFIQAMQQIYSELLRDLLAVVSHVALLVSPLSILLGFSLDWLPSLLLILKI
jgi:hypothetical protein